MFAFECVCVCTFIELSASLGKKDSLGKMFFLLLFSLCVVWVCVVTGTKYCMLGIIMRKSAALMAWAFQVVCVFASAWDARKMMGDEKLFSSYSYKLMHTRMLLIQICFFLGDGGRNRMKKNSHTSIEWLCMILILFSGFFFFYFTLCYFLLLLAAAW